MRSFFTLVISSLVVFAFSPLAHAEEDVKTLQDQILTLRGNAVLLKSKIRKQEEEIKKLKAEIAKLNGALTPSATIGTTKSKTERIEDNTSEKGWPDEWVASFQAQEKFGQQRIPELRKLIIRKKTELDIIDAQIKRYRNLPAYLTSSKKKKIEVSKSIKLMERELKSLEKGASPEVKFHSFSSTTLYVVYRGFKQGKVGRINFPLRISRVLTESEVQVCDGNSRYSSATFRLQGVKTRGMKLGEKITRLSSKRIPDLLWIIVGTVSEGRRKEIVLKPIDEKAWKIAYKKWQDRKGIASSSSQAPIEPIPSNPTKTSSNPLESLDSMVRSIRQARIPKIDDPRKTAKWNTMTTIQQEDALVAYEARLEAWKKKPTINYRGKKVSWTMQVDDVKSDKLTGEYVLLLISSEGYMASLSFPKEKRSQLSEIKRGQILRVKGTIEDYQDSPTNIRPESSFFGVSTRQHPTFSVKLSNHIFTLSKDTVLVANQFVDASNIIFVVDRSGSAIDTFEAMKTDILKSIDNLTEKSRFQILCFGKTILPFSDALVVATATNKKKAKEFLDNIIPVGQGSMISSIQQAMGYSSKSTVIVVSGDGREADNQAVINSIKRSRIPIYTVLYGSRPPKAVELMQKIASTTKGKYVFRARE